MAGIQYPQFAPDLQEESNAIDRKRRIADALLQQGMTPQQGQKVGRFYVAPNPLQSVVSGLGGLVMGKRLDEEKADLVADAQVGRKADLETLTKALQGPAPRPEGLSNPVPEDTPQARLRAAIGSIQDPQLQQHALGLLGKPQEPFTLKPGEVRHGPTGEIVARGPEVKPGNPESNAPYTLTPGAKRLGPDGKVIAENPRSESATPYYSVVQTPQGLMAFDARTGRLSPINVGGGPVVGAQNDPKLQGDLARAKATGKEVGEATGQAQVDLPRVVANANNALQLVDQMIGSEDGTVKPHPGFQSSVGLGVGMLGAGYIPGSDTANFGALLDQVKGGAFLEAFNSLKGGGQITEVEGKKATDAITRMQKAQSEAEFIKAAREYQSVIKLGVERAQQKAGTQQPTTQPYSGPERRGGVVDFNSLKNSRGR